MATEAVIGTGGTGVAIEAVACAGGVVTEIDIGFSGLCIGHTSNNVDMEYAGFISDMRYRTSSLRIAGLVTIGTGLACSHSVSVVLSIGRCITMTSITAEAVSITPGAVAARS